MGVINLRCLRSDSTSDRLRTDVVVRQVEAPERVEADARLQGNSAAAVRAAVSWLFFPVTLFLLLARLATSLLACRSESQLNRGSMLGYS